MPDSFLDDHPSRRSLTLDARGLNPVAAFDGRGNHPLEVALATSERRPRAEDMRRAWKGRHGGTASPLLLVVAYEVDGARKASICGPAGDEPPVEADLDLDLVERIAAAALEQPSRNHAIRFLGGILAEVESELPGIRNHGMLATQELRDGVPQRPDWAAACERSRSLLSSSGRELVEKLGFHVEHHSIATTILSVGDARRAVAVFLEETEEFEAPTARFGDTSPVTHALAHADRAELPWVVVTRGAQIRLYSAKPDVGVGRKGRADTYVEANLALVPSDSAGYVTLLFSAEALGTDGTLPRSSKRPATMPRRSGCVCATGCTRTRFRDWRLRSQSAMSARLTNRPLQRSTSRLSPFYSGFYSSHTRRTKTYSRTARTARTGITR